VRRSSESPANAGRAAPPEAVRRSIDARDGSGCDGAACLVLATTGDVRIGWGLAGPDRLDDAIAQAAAMAGVEPMPPVREPATVSGLVGALAAGAPPICVAASERYASCAIVLCGAT
jgi:hypothetical protein